MGVVVPIGFAQVSMQFTLDSDAEPMVVTIGCDVGTEDDPSILADAVWSRLTTSDPMWDPSSISDEYNVGPFVASIMTSTGPQIGTGTEVLVGTNAGVESLPNNCAVLVQKRTARGGRKGRGRAYFPPVFPTEGAVEANGNLQPTFIASWQDSMTTWLLSSDSEGQPLVLLHSEEAGPIAPDPITGLVVATKIATQRTRLRP